MAVKHMILNEIPTTKILIIDVENEYNHLCKKLNGKRRFLLVVDVKLNNFGLNKL